jgi:hypothetical protein
MIGLIFAVCIQAHNCNYYVLDTFPTQVECEIDRKAFIRDKKISPAEAKSMWCDELKDSKL